MLCHLHIEGLIAKQKVKENPFIYLPKMFLFQPKRKVRFLNFSTVRLSVLADILKETEFPFTKTSPLSITSRFFPLTHIKPVLHFMGHSTKVFAKPKQAIKRITKLLVTLSPEVNVEQSVSLDVQLQEKLEAGMAS